MKQESGKSHERLNHLLLVALVSFLALCAPAAADPEPNSAGASAGLESAGGLIPKRQYLIAPRVGRAAQPSSIWSALEEAAISSPGQIQPNRGYPGPLRSSLLFLIGNRHMIGQRSGGLFPQPRIGRRAAPIGLMPQPRVGRRSLALDGAGLDGDDELAADGQQEVAVATLSDSSYGDALESLASTSDRTGNEAIERPTHRAISFVPRLGKREHQDAGGLERLLCRAYGLGDCEYGGYASEGPRPAQMLALVGALARGIIAQEAQRDAAAAGGEQQEVAELVKREDSFAANQIGGSKRVAFTPRIGR